VLALLRTVYLRAVDVSELHRDRGRPDITLSLKQIASVFYSWILSRGTKRNAIN